MRNVHKLLYKKSWDNWKVLALVSVLMLLAVGLEALSPWPFKILIDNVFGGDELNPALEFLHQYFPTPELLGLFAIFVYFASTLIFSIVEYMHSVLTKIMVRDVNAAVSLTAFQNFESMAIGSYSKLKIGDYIYRLGYDVSAFGELLETGILPIFTSLLYLATTAVIMFLINVQLALLAFLALPFLAYGLYFFNKKIDRATKRAERLSSATFSFIEESLKHLKIIQAFIQEERSSEAFARRNQSMLGSELRMFRLDFLLSLLVGILLAISYSLVMLYGIHAVFSGTLTAGLFVVFVLYLDNLTSPVLSIIYAATAAREALTKINRLDVFLNPHARIEDSGTVSEVKTGDIHFLNVTLESPEGKRILSNLTFTIPAGKCTVVFGGSGSGKTSVANLLLRFVEKPTHGHIVIDDIPLEEYEVKKLREDIAYVPQEITLFNESIQSNITYGNAHHSYERVRDAVRLSDSADFIRRLPRHLQFKVGENGTNLSGGQRQRIMMARAFMKSEAKIAIFDEAFSALDVNARRNVLRNFGSWSQGKTSILISNIFDVISAADHIVVLNHGKLLYSGPTERLPKEIALSKMIMENEPQQEEE